MHIKIITAQYTLLILTATLSKRSEPNLKIGVLSDSHVDDFASLPQKAVNLLKDTDLIVHAGDYIGKKLLDELRALGNFKGVYGNMDPPEIREELPENIVFELNGFQIGVTHPSEGGPPSGIKKRIKTKFKQVNAIIYGHTHLPTNEVIHDTLYFNPGSITGKFPSRKKTLGILKTGKKLEGEIIEI